MRASYLIVGAGFFGATFAHLAAKYGKSVIVVDRNPYVGGMAYSAEVCDIPTHSFGPHAFHTNNEEIWRFLQEFTDFNNYQYRPKAYHHGKMYSLPINMNTLNSIWGVITPAEAEKKLKSVRVDISEPKNLEEWALSQIGEELYYTFYYGYTKKQWGKEPKELSVSIIKRLPIRLTYDDRYFDDEYQGIPKYGYTKLIENMLAGIEVRLGIDYIENREELDKLAEKVVYTGPLDALYNYKIGKLEYRSLKFETKILDGDFQGNSVINYTEYEIPYTRVIEHKHFYPGTKNDKTVITYEYPADYNETGIPYYPITDAKNNQLYSVYKDKAIRQGLLVGGRLGSHRYQNMDGTIGQAFSIARKEIGEIKLWP